MLYLIYQRLGNLPYSVRTLAFERKPLALSRRNDQHISSEDFRPLTFQVCQCVSMCVVCGFVWWVRVRVRVEVKSPALSPSLLLFFLSKLLVRLEQAFFFASHVFCLFFIF